MSATLAGSTGPHLLPHVISEHSHTTCQDTLTSPMRAQDSKIQPRCPCEHARLLSLRSPSYFCQILLVKQGQTRFKGRETKLCLSEASENLLPSWIYYGLWLWSGSVCLGWYERQWETHTWAQWERVRGFPLCALDVGTWVPHVCHPDLELSPTVLPCFLLINNSLWLHLTIVPQRVL